MKLARDGIQLSFDVAGMGSPQFLFVHGLATTILDLMGDPITAEFGALENRPTEIWSMRSDVTKARSVLGLPPARSLREGLERTISWYRQVLTKSSSLFSA